MVRVRFAPSPTGNLHIGTLRTALFSWLYARHHKGVFVLRIEDTDTERSESHFEDNIHEGLRWFGLSVDEGPFEGGQYGPYRQSERMVDGLYQRYADQLLSEGKAYRCFETDAQLDAERELASQQGIPYKYSRTSLYLSEAEIQQKLADKVPYTIRFKMPDKGDLVYTDMIRDIISFDLSLISDFVIIKSDGSPTYNFAVVVDDFLMKITHVIRGEDHISNMPRQLLLFEAFGQTPPAYAHLPMILGPDKSKLSKRHGATSITDYRDMGYLSDSLFNFLSLLGWSPKGEKELMTREEIAEQFGIDRVNKANAVFDIVKLNWMNGQYLRALSDDEYCTLIEDFLSSESRVALSQLLPQIKQHALLSVKGNLTVLADINTYLRVFFKSDDQYQVDILQFSFGEQDKQVLALFLQKLQRLSDVVSSEDVDRLMSEVVAETGFGKGKVFKPIRLAVSAEGTGPHIGDLIVIIGKQRICNRLSLVLA